MVDGKNGENEKKSQTIYKTEVLNVLEYHLPSNRNPLALFPCSALILNLKTVTSLVH